MKLSPPLLIPPIKKIRGFSTLELMIALMILSSVLTESVLVSLGLPSSLANGHERHVATTLARKLLQSQLLQGLSGFTDVTSIATTTTRIGSVIYLSTLETTLRPDGLTKDLVSSTKWLDSNGTSQQITFNGVVTDFKNASANMCGNVLSGDWSHVKVSALPFSYPIQTVAVSSTTLVASDLAAKSSKDPTIFIFSLASSTNPVLLGSFDNATTTKAGSAALTMQGSTLYTASAYAAGYTTCASGAACSQLQIFDISNPASPLLIRNFTLASSTEPFASGSGGQSAGKSIFYQNNVIYLGLQKPPTAQGEEFNIIDVHDPSHPKWIGGYSIGRTINQILIDHDFAYLATDDPLRELVILNVHDPAHIALAGVYNAIGSSSYGYGETLAKSGSSLLFGRSYVLNQSQFDILDISSSTLPVRIGGEPVTSTTTSSSIESVLIKSFLAFVLTNSALEIWDVSSSVSPKKFTSDVPLPGKTPAAITNGLACRGNTLYMASIDSTKNGYLTIVTSS